MGYSVLESNLQTNTFPGFIYFPGKKEGKIPCSLTITADKEITFELVSDTKLQFIYPYPLILGHFHELGKVTMINCDYSSYSSSSLGQYFKYNVEIVLIGLSAPNIDEIVFSGFTFQSKGLNEWLKIGCWDLELNCKLVVHNKQFQKTFSITPELEFTIFNSTSNVRTRDEIVFKSHSGIQIQSKSSEKVLSLESVLLLYKRTQKFFTLISQKAFELEFLNADINTNISASSKIKTKAEPVEVFFKTNTAKPSFSLANLRIDYKEIELNLENVLTNWFKRQEFEHDIDLLLTFHNNIDGSRKTHFFDAISAFEGIDKKADSSDLFFKDRLNKYNDQFEKFYGDQTENTLIKFVNTRNFIAHGNEDKKHKEILNQFELLYAAECLISISTYILLLELECSPELLYEKLESCATNFRGIMAMNKRRKENLIDLG